MRNKPPPNIGWWPTGGHSLSWWDGASAEGAKEVTEKDDIEYYQKMFCDSIIWAVAIVAAFALFVLLA